MTFKILLQLLNKMEVVSNMIPQALVVYIYNENWNNTTLLIIVKKINGDVASNDGWQLQYIYIHLPLQLTPMRRGGGGQTMFP